MTGVNSVNTNSIVGAGSAGPGFDGTQAIRRAVAILKVIASGRYPGVTLDDVANTMQLSRSTTHRILKALVSEGLVVQDDSKRRYTIGQLTYELSLSVVHDFEFAAQWSGLVDSVARRTMHTSYLLARSGIEAVCIQKVESRAALRMIPVDVGQRRPLGVGAGALALLSGFEPREIQTIVRNLTPLLSAFPNVTPERIVRDAMETRERGYSVSKGMVIAESIGIGVLLPDAKGAHLAVSIAAPLAVVADGDIKGLAAIMHSEILAITAKSGA
jgi:DNA-binding IclR family transcriptional regulator